MNVVDTNVSVYSLADHELTSFPSALLAGWPLPLRMEFAAWAAARVAKVIGGRGNLPTRATVREAVEGFSPALRKAITDWK